MGVGVPASVGRIGGVPLISVVAVALIGGVVVVLVLGGSVGRIGGVALVTDVALITLVEVIKGDGVGLLSGYVVATSVGIKVGVWFAGVGIALLSGKLGVLDATALGCAPVLLPASGTPQLTKLRSSPASRKCRPK